jgi:hemerythrin-like domain-containing protein
MIGIQIGAKHDSGFDDPIGMLTDCHRRIESFLRVLCMVADRARGRALSKEETAALNGALSYFRSGGRRHTADEEESLFPRLRKEHVDNALAELQRLEGEHRRADELHEVVEKLYLRWIEAGRLSDGDERTLLGSTAELERLYETHIKVEEEQVFPEAARTLDSQSIEEMGREFRARRA